MPSFRNSIDGPLVPCVGFLRMQIGDSQVLLPGGPGRGQVLESGRTWEDLGTHAVPPVKGLSGVEAGHGPQRRSRLVSPAGLWDLRLLLPSGRYLFAWKALLSCHPCSTWTPTSCHLVLRLSHPPLT